MPYFHTPVIPRTTDFYTHTSLHEEMCATLKQANDYYILMIEAGEHPNLDQIGYTSHITLEIFRKLLNQPDLHVEELAATLRESRMHPPSVHHLPVQKSRPPRPLHTQDREWADIMARFLVTRTNENQTL